MSGITLSASVRQNLLSLQSTADLLSTTQNRLATGNKVNSALDNPTNFFTAQGLNNRAGDINNLLDGIGNGVQILQAANTGITSLQKLVDSAKSIANQALQTTGGYSTKSNVSTTITGATADNLLGTTTYASASATGSVVFSGAAGGATAAVSTSTLGGTAGTLVASAAVTGNGTGTPNIDTSTLLFSAGGATGNGLSTQANSKFTDGSTLSVNGKTITFKAAAVPTAANLAAGSSTLAASGAGANVVTDASGNSTIYMGTTAESAATVGDLMAAVDVASGTQYVSAVASGVGTLSGTASTITAGVVSLKSSTGADLSVTGSADMLKTLNLTASTGTALTTVGAARATATGSTGSLIQDGSTLNVNGKTITFKNANAADVNAIPTGYGKPSGST
jgi:flagellin